MTSTDYSPEKLAARAEITDRVNAWAQGVDRKDWALAASIFHPGATDNHGIFDGPADELVEMLKKRHASITSSQHFITNISIIFSGDNRAAVESYCLVWQRYSAEDREVRSAILGGAEVSDDPMDLLMGARYVDFFERKGGAWKIARRETVFETSMKFDVLPDGPKMGPTWLLGRRDTEDTLFRMRAMVAAS